MSDEPKKSKRMMTAEDLQPETQPEYLDHPPLPIVHPLPNMGKFGKGYRRDTHDTSKDQTIRHLLGASRASNPTEAMEMEQFIAGIFGVKDQKQTSECVAFAIARCAQLRCSVMGVPLKEWPSTTCAYTVGRAKERAQEGATPESQPLVDEGSIPMLVVQGVNESGLCTDSQWPFDPSTINEEPDPEKLINASTMKLPGYYRINSAGAQRVQDVMQAIAAGYPILIGVQVDPAFEEYAGGIAEEDVTPPIPNAVNAPDLANDLGGHGLCIYGYKTFANGVVLFRGCNSWGENTWGDHGLFWASVAWLCADSVMDIIVITCDPSHHAVAA